MSLNSVGIVSEEISDQETSPRHSGATREAPSMIVQSQCLVSPIAGLGPWGSRYRKLPNIVAVLEWCCVPASGLKSRRAKIHRKAKDDQ